MKKSVVEVAEDDFLIRSPDQNDPIEDEDKEYECKYIL